MTTWEKKEDHKEGKEEHEIEMSRVVVNVIKVQYIQA